MLAWFPPLSFAVLYRFTRAMRAGNGALPAWSARSIVWIGATLGARLYFGHLNDYTRSYGHLNSAVMLLLWLYLSNAAVLIGGEMNSEIEKAIAEPDGAVNGDGHRRSGQGRKG